MEENKEEIRAKIIDFFSLQEQNKTCENERLDQFVKNSSHNGNK